MAKIKHNKDAIRQLTQVLAALNRPVTVKELVEHQLLKPLALKPGWVRATLYRLSTAAGKTVRRTKDNPPKYAMRTPSDETAKRRVPGEAQRQQEAGEYTGPAVRVVVREGMLLSVTPPVGVALEIVWQ